MIPFDLSRRFSASDEKQSPNGKNKNSNSILETRPYQNFSSPKIEFEPSRTESEAMDLAIKTNNVRENGTYSLIETFSKEKSVNFLREKAKTLIQGSEAPMEVESEHWAFI